jgi:D-serine deaminase-like pyridoxal phosphate-dependent protein
VDVLDLPTSSLIVVERGPFERNVATMAQRWPGTRLRPHVKAFKSGQSTRLLGERG